ncbi:alpha/beta hydrolase [Citricoccus sp. GCM10030269]|uniref:alpha/beta hydrolase n=1 Tax=Citricoccus sp. GCM10030269 TaxID=3273388 RepID=UPI0036187F2B
MPLHSAFSPRWPDRWPLRASGALLAVLFLAACTPASDPDGADGQTPSGGASHSGQSTSGDPEADGEQPTSGSPAAPEAVPEGLEDFYGQQPNWQSCEQDAGEFQCATVEAPLDYADPTGERIDLALIRTDGAGDGAPHLVLNPGGPGASGVDMVVDSLEFVVSDEVRENYAVVGFDPRGVSRSTPVTCLPDEEMDAAREQNIDPSTEEGLQQARDAAQDFAEACDENTGDILGHVDTDTAAQDMDLIRGVLGDEQLNYLGFSYGTSLGASYAGQFPDNVGRMVLDGAMDPSLGEFDVTLGQATAFEKAIRSWADYCLATTECPLSGTVENAVAQLQRLLTQIEDSPMTSSDGRQVPASAFVAGLITPLYSDENWPMLTSAVQDAMNGNPDLMLYLSDLNAGRDEDGTYTSNINDAFTAINCLDFSSASDTETLRSQAAELEEASPTIGRFLAYGGVNCADWPEEPVGEPAPASAPGAAPIVVIGTQGDPATPYEWAPALAEQLESAVLVTWNGQGHTAYGRAGECIGGAVDEYLIDGVVPEDGLTCN